MKIIKGTNTSKVTTSWVIFICPTASPCCASNRVAGIIRLYSNRAIIQLNKMACQSGASYGKNFKCPYHAKVIKQLAITKRNRAANIGRYSAKRSGLFYDLFGKNIFYKFEIFSEFICETGFKKSRGNA